MQLIADVLSFNNNQEALAQQMQHPSIDWDGFVIVGSAHLMLPALYCRLKAKNLLPLLPDDLNLYLEEIAEINRGRNETLLQEAHDISKIFKKEHIDHVFIKGMALIAGQAFKDPAERMIGDMDILVAHNQLHQAFDILVKHGYTDTVNSVLEQKYRRHLPRQISPQKIGAVELHSEILVHNYKHLLKIEQVLKNKRIVQGIAIPSLEDCIKISIWARQINDRGHRYGYFNFKTIYDCLALNLPNNKILLANLSDDKHSQSFLHISNVFFKELIPYKSSLYSKLITRQFKLRLNNHILGNLVHLVIKLSVNIHLRLKLLAFSKSYRTHLLKNKILGGQKQDAKT